MGDPEEQIKVRHGGKSSKQKSKHIKMASPKVDGIENTGHFVQA